MNKEIAIKVLSVLLSLEIIAVGVVTLKDKFKLTRKMAGISLVVILLTYYGMLAVDAFY